MESASKPGSQSMGVERGFAPSQGQGTASLVGFGATPQLFLVKPIQREKSSKVAAAKRPAPKLRASSDAPPSCSFQRLCCVAPNGRDRTAGLATITVLSRKQGFRACRRDQRALRSPSGLLRIRNLMLLAFFRSEAALLGRANIIKACAAFEKRGRESQMELTLPCLLRCAKWN